MVYGFPDPGHSAGFWMAYAFMGLWLLDLTIRFCFSGLISYGRFANIAAPAVLCAATAGVYLFRGVFFAPPRGELTAFAGMVAAYLYLTLAKTEPRFRLALYAGIGLTLLAIPMEILALRFGGVPSGDDKRSGQDQGNVAGSVNGLKFLPPPVWDLSQRVPLFRGWFLYVTLLVLLSVELVLQMEGQTLLGWL